MIGRINYYKGVDLLADALPLIDYDRIGTITLAGKFDECISTLKFDNNLYVRIVNKYLTNDEFDKFVNENHLLLMPYLEASQSGVAAVSLGYNIPAIATQVGGIPEQLPADTAYFLEKASPEALAEAINAATANAEEYLYKNNIYNLWQMVCNGSTWLKCCINTYPTNNLNENCITTFEHIGSGEGLKMWHLTMLLP